MRGVFVHLEAQDIYDGEDKWYLLGPAGAAQAVEAVERLESFYALLGALAHSPGLIWDGGVVAAWRPERSSRFPHLSQWLRLCAPEARLFYPSGAEMRRGGDGHLYGEQLLASKLILAELPFGDTVPYAEEDLDVRLQMSRRGNVRMGVLYGPEDYEDNLLLASRWLPVAEWLGALRWATGERRPGA